MKTGPRKGWWFGAAALVAAGVVLGNRGSQPGACCPGVSCLTAMAAEAANAPEKAKLPRLVDLGADKCIPCKMMAPVLKDLAKDYQGQLQVDFIDVWKNPDAGKAYHIKLIPTQIFFDAAGRELFRHEGFFSKADILAKWRELGVGLKAEGSPKAEAKK